jgi:hypothetical protein
MRCGPGEFLLEMQAQATLGTNMRHATTRHMRRVLQLTLSLLLVAELSGCGGASAFSGDSGSSSSGSSSSSSSSSSSASSSSSSSGSFSSSSSSSGADARADFLYEVSGLNSGASVTLLLNGGYPQVVTQNTPSGVEEFFMSGSPAAVLALPITGTYAITVETQPSGQTCAVANGSGTVAFDNPVAMVTCTASSGAGMASVARQELAVPSSGDGMSALRPRPRQAASSWSGSTGDLWLFGGQSADSAGAARLLGDFWKYDSNAREWLQLSGLARAGSSPSDNDTFSIPSARSYAASWIDAAGTLWLFGGQGLGAGGTSALLNDLWAFNSSAGTWTQAIQSRGPTPSARMAASFWVDPSGMLWLFGGYGMDATGAASQLDDLWRYSPQSKSWQQESSSVSAAASN